jgi:hypothetical protein
LQRTGFNPDLDLKRDWQGLWQPIVTASCGTAFGLTRGCGMRIVPDIRGMI